MLSAASCDLQTDGRRLVTPSPGPRRLVKTPAAAHPLPQGGEGRRIITRVWADSSGLETEGWGNVLPLATVPA